MSTQTVVGELIGSYGRLINAGGSLCINRPYERFVKLIQIAKLDAILTFEDADYESKAWFDASPETFKKILQARYAPKAPSKLLLTPR